MSKATGMSKQKVSPRSNPSQPTPTKRSSGRQPFATNDDVWTRIAAAVCADIVEYIPIDYIPTIVESIE